MRLRDRQIAGAHATDFSFALAIIAAVGLAWRVAYLLWMRHVPVGGDGPFYHYGAIYLAEGHGYTNPLARLIAGVDVPSALHPPAWIAVLAGPSAVGLRSYLSHQLVAAAVGTVTIVMTGLAGRIAFGRRAGLIAAALVALYPNVWLYEREVAVETLALAGAAVTIWLAYRYRAQPTWRGAVALGVAVGVLALTRSELIMLAVFLVTPLIASTSSVPWPVRLRWLAMAGAACALVIAPWTIYNTARFDRPVLLSTGFGLALVVGNCEPVYSGAALGSFKLGCAYREKDISRDPSIADGQYRRKAFDFMRDNASRLPVVAGARVGRTFGFYQPAQELHLDRDRKSPLWVLQAGLLVYWMLVPLALGGVVVARRRRVPVYPLLGFVTAALIISLLTIGQTRYRSAAEVPLVLLAAVALDAAFGRWRRRVDASTSR